MRDPCNSPIERSGFGDGKGHLSFNKMVTFTALWFFGVALWYIITDLRQIPPWFVWSFGFVVIGAGFGLKGFAMAAARRTEAMTQTDTTAFTGNVAEIIKVVQERRDHEQGAEPTP